MKKASILVAICCLAFISNAQNTQEQKDPVSEVSHTAEIKTELVATSNEVQIYYSSVEDLAGNSMLDIRFINTSEKAVTFSWEVTKEGQTFNSAKAITIAPGKIFVQRSALEMKGTFDFAAYSINLTTK